MAQFSLNNVHKRGLKHHNFFCILKRLLFYEFVCEVWGLCYFKNRPCQLFHDKKAFHGLMSKSHGVTVVKFFVTSMASLDTKVDPFLSEPTTTQEDISSAFWRGCCFMNLSVECGVPVTLKTGLVNSFMTKKHSTGSWVNLWAFSLLFWVLYAFLLFFFCCVGDDVIFLIPGFSFLFVSFLGLRLWIFLVTLVGLWRLRNKNIKCQEHNINYGHQISANYPLLSFLGNDID